MTIGRWPWWPTPDFPHDKIVSASHGVYCTALTASVCSQLVLNQEDSARTRSSRGREFLASTGTLLLKSSRRGFDSSSQTTLGGRGSSSSFRRTRTTYSPRSTFR